MNNTFMESDVAKFTSDDFLQNKMKDEDKPAKKDMPKIKPEIVSYPELGENINEYTTNNISSMAFPQLFPYGEHCIFDNIPGIDDADTPSQEEQL